MKKRPSEYSLLRYYEKQADYCVTSNVAQTLKTNPKLTAEMVIWLRDNGLLAQGMKSVDGVDTSANKITSDGVKRLHDLIMERRLFAFSVINAISAAASLLVAVASVILAWNA